MQFLGSAATGSDFGQLDRYVLDVLQPAMDFDVTSSSIPVWSNTTDQNIDHPARTIYEKGASLIRMMQGFLSEATLISGLRKYLDT
jgi:aminopeptidase N